MIMLSALPIAYKTRGSIETLRLLRSIERRNAILALDLSGLAIVTEAATGAYASTAVIAAMAGGKVYACGRDTRHHGSAQDGIAATLELARQAGVDGQITASVGVPPAALKACDIITNSGRIRPIDGSMVEALRPDAVIALMFEAWEFRATDLDRAACDRRGIRIAAVNEQHPDVAVFPFLGQLCVRQLRDAGMKVSGKRVAVLCDNPFAPFLRDGIVEAGGKAVLFRAPADLTEGDWDAVVVALKPSAHDIDRHELGTVGRLAPKALMVQFWGDIDREAARELGIPVYPPKPPARGHMGILLDRLGHEPIVRLQAGSLKAAEIVRRGGPIVAGGIAALLPAASG